MLTLEYREYKGITFVKLSGTPPNFIGSGNSRRFKGSVLSVASNKDFSIEDAYDLDCTGLDVSEMILYLQGTNSKVGTHCFIIENGLMFNNKEHGGLGYGFDSCEKVSLDDLITTIKEFNDWWVDNCAKY